MDAIAVDVELTQLRSAIAVLEERAARLLGEAAEPRPGIVEDYRMLHDHLGWSREMRLLEVALTREGGLSVTEIIGACNALQGILPRGPDFGHYHAAIERLRRRSGSQVA